MSTKLETELKRGYSTFSLWGEVSLSDDSFPEPQTSKRSTFKYVNCNFAVKIKEGELIFVQMMGGYDPSKPVLKRFSKNRSNDGGSNMLDIKWDMRNNEKILEKVSPMSFINVRIERDEKGKLITKQFLSEIDAAKYLNEKLENGTKVFVGGDIQYSRYEDRIQRHLNVRTIALNEGYTDKEGVEHEAHKNFAQMKQTYLVDYTSLSKHYEQELEDEGEAIVSAWVPQYIGKENNIEIKKTLALPQTIVVKANEDLKTRIKVLDKLFGVEERDVVREITLKNEIVEGYDEVQGDIEITPELQELIDLKLATKESLKKDLTIRGNRISKVVLITVGVKKDSDNNPTIMMQDKYSPEVLSVEEEEEEKTTDDSKEIDPFADVDDDAQDDDLTSLFND